VFKNVFIVSICLNTDTISSMYLGHHDASTSHSTNEEYRHLPPFDRDVHGLPHWLSGILNNPLIYLANSSGLFQKWDIVFIIEAILQSEYYPGISHHAANSRS